ncbi:hypothetical protein PTKIN_Ptkin16aG0033400 [Pterospermum kingtungense]
MLSLGGAMSFIGGVFVSKIFDILIEKLGSSEIVQFASEKKIQEELQKLKEELQDIRALLDDAEERQIKDQSVKNWLSEIQNVAYDLDDIVDELETETSRRKLMLERRGSSSKIPRLISDPFVFGGMMSKIKDITAKLKDLEPQRNQLPLRMIDCPKSIRMKERPQPTSLEIDTQVFGRDKDKETILELVFKSDDEGNFVIPIVGMGGIGKTTLAQLVYNDPTVQNHFDLKAWVCVSDDFDVTRITKEILQSLTSEPCDENNLNSLQEKLKKMLYEKKFLIVLDDVWNENYHNWTILQSPFLATTPGSKIIVTTRSLDVSSTMGASHAHSLQVLSEDDCLSLFAQHALGARDFAGHPNLKEVGEKIVRKCSGLPLAAKTLGGLLRTNVEYDAWTRILESEIWKLSDHRCGIIPALQLSYYHLPPHLKRCFSYCAIFPKDYEFEEKEVILLWRAEGLLQEARDKQSIEVLGHEYFKDLLSRSLLQRSNKDRSRFVMHDLINDLSQSVAGEICFRIEGDKNISKHARHLSYIRGGECSKLEKLPSEMENLINLCYLDITGADSLKGLENVVETQDAWKAKLHDKVGLEKLELNWSKDFENRKGEMEKEVLDLLQPSKKLKELAIKCYWGSTLAKWVGDSSFSELKSLCLDNCPNCTPLPSIGQLPLLENLRIEGLHKWENWNFCDVDEEARKFPRLRELCIMVAH